MTSPEIDTALPQMSRVHVRCKVMGRVVKSSVRSEEISIELPADALGSIVADSVNAAWRSGYDPASKDFPLKVEISFE